jgi:hypothetical protein
MTGRFIRFYLICGPLVKRERTHCLPEILALPASIKVSGSAFNLHREFTAVCGYLLDIKFDPFWSFFYAAIWP